MVDVLLCRGAALNLVTQVAEYISMYLQTKIERTVLFMAQHHDSFSTLVTVTLVLTSENIVAGNKGPMSTEWLL